MRTHERLRISLAELGIVIVGVMIALAADSWREGWVESRQEAQYLERLQADVSNGLDVLLLERKTYQAVMEACVALMELADSDPSMDAALTVDNLVEATQMGFGRNEMASDVTYRELVQSGRLSLIQDRYVREGVVAYYRNVDLLIQSLEDLPLVNNWFAEQTGFYPMEVSVYGTTLSQHDRDRLLSAATGDAQFIQQLRSLHAQAHFNDRLFVGLIAQAEDLLLKLD